jgi:lysozyme
MPPATLPTISPYLLSNVKTAEGCKLVAYRDTKGLWTIGYGHLLDQSIDWTGHTISQSTADGLLAQDIAERAVQAATLPEYACCSLPARRDALIECIFNLGIGTWMKDFPATRQSLQHGQWDAAANNLLHSPEWIAEVGLKRVARLADSFQSGSY